MEHSDCSKLYGTNKPEGAVDSQAGKTRGLVMTALVAALVTVATVFFKIPTLATQGYVHLGDAFVFMGVILLGRNRGAAAAAIGSGMADLIGGYPHWMIWSFLIKGAMAFIFGAIAERNVKLPGLVLTVLAYLVSGTIMVAGYYLASALMYGSFVVPLASVPWNIAQAVVGVTVSAVAGAFLTRNNHMGN